MPNFIKGLIIGIFEISNGINNIANLNISLTYRLVMISFILSFSSLMVLMQIYSFVSKAKVKFKEMVVYKLIHASISAIITYILTKFIFTSSIQVFENIHKSHYALKLNASTIYMFTICIAIFLSLIMFRKKRQSKNLSPKKGDTH